MTEPVASAMRRDTATGFATLLRIIEHLAVEEQPNRQQE